MGRFAAPIFRESADRLEGGPPAAAGRPDERPPPIDLHVRVPARSRRRGNI